MTIEDEILQYLHHHPLSNRGEITLGITNPPSDRTIKRLLADAITKGIIEVEGRGPATKYSLTPQSHIPMPLDLATYFSKDIDERIIQETFNFRLIKELLPKVSLFTDEEKHILIATQQQFKNNVSGMSDLEYRKEMERLGVEILSNIRKHLLIVGNRTAIKREADRFR